MTDSTAKPGDLIDLYERTVELLDNILASNRAVNARMMANSKAILDIVQLLNQKGLIDRGDADQVIESLRSAE